MKVIVLTNNLKGITASHYQEEYLKHLELNNNFFYYGRNYSYYNPEDSFTDILSKSQFGNNLDLIIFGHSWLIDTPGVKNISYHKKLSINIDVPVIGFLNKEYVNLEKKLNYFKNNNFNCVFTHCIDYELFAKITKKKFFFQPFAGDHSMYKPSNKKNIDLFYSGNMAPNYKHEYSNIRKEIHNSIYNNFFLLRFKKNNYKNYKIHWKIKYNLKNRIIDKIIQNMMDYRIPYARKISKSKLCFNAISPANLVNTRHFEAMLSKSIPFCFKSSVYSKINGMSENIIQFKDQNDFYEKFIYYMENQNEIKKLSLSSYEYALKHHTWEKRSSEFFNIINKI